MPANPVQLTQTGPEMSPLVPGLMRLLEWNLSASELLDWIEACLDLGLTTFDHADIYGGYGCEARFGEALALKPSIRQRMQLVTKCGINLVTPSRPQYTIHRYDTTREHIIASAEESLRALQTDVIDILLVHRPDPLMDADDVASAFDTLHQDGKVRHFGVSNFTPAQFDLLASRLDMPLVTNQVEFSVTHMDPIYDGTFDQAQKLRRRPMVWSPLGGGGIFTGGDAQSDRVRQALGVVAAAHGVAPDQVALAWVMMHPCGPIPVLGTGKLDRLRGAVGALDLTLSRDEWFTIWTASTGHEVP